MSAARQPKTLFGAARGFVLALMLAMGVLPEVAASMPDPVVTDPASGLAINGFDPVAYFADASAQPGRQGMEYRFAGNTWRFRNEGNRAAFAENPEVYSPQFGGYDPVAIARGVSVPGHPQVWLVSGQRLYLFYSREARAEFMAAPRRIIDLAERKWPEVQRKLP
jgi:hypothetical protein